MSSPSPIADPAAPAPSRSLFRPLLLKLEWFSALTPGEQEAIRGLPVEIRQLAPNESLLLQGQAPEGVTLVMSGVAVRYKMRAEGTRQIIGLCLPGDLCNVHADLILHADHSLAALTPLVVGLIDPADLNSLLRSHCRLARGIAWVGIVEESIGREWILNVGSRSAFERLAHFLCELYHRLEIVGLAQDSSCDMPIRQAELADVLALSTVHVNRTLMELRRAGLVSLNHRRLVIHDLAQLCAVAGFDPAYLHTRRRWTDVAGA